MKDLIDVYQFVREDKDPIRVFELLLAEAKEAKDRGKFDGKVMEMHLGDICAQGNVLALLRRLTEIGEHEQEIDR